MKSVNMPGTRAPQAVVVPLVPVQKLALVISIHCSAVVLVI